MTPQEDFSAWLNEHYDMRPSRRWRELLRRANRRSFVCKRCHRRVGYVTKHAVVRHGDAIEVMPVRNDDPALAEAY